MITFFALDTHTDTHSWISFFIQTPGTSCDFLDMHLNPSFFFNKSLAFHNSSRAFVLGDFHSKTRAHSCAKTRQLSINVTRVERSLWARNHVSSLFGTSAPVMGKADLKVDLNSFFWKSGDSFNLCFNPRSPQVFDSMLSCVCYHS